MRSLPLPALLLVPVLAAVASGGPSTDHFNPLVTELNAREAALPTTGLTKAQKKEARALKKSFRALEADSADLAGDLKMAKKMAAALDSGYPGDPTMGGVLDGLLDGLEGDVEAGRDDLATTLELVEAGKLRDRADGKLGKADGFLSRAAAEPVRKKRAQFLFKAEKQVARGAALAAKANPAPPGTSAMAATVNGRPWAANADFGTAVTGSVEVSESTGGLRKITMIGREILRHSGSPPSAPLPGESRSLEITVTGTGGDIATGTHPVGNSGGVSVSILWIFEDEDGNVSTYVGTGGSVTFSSIVASATGSAKGTFGFTVLDGATGSTLSIASGTFDVKDLPAQPVP